jgi:hypothetical protein
MLVERGSTGLLQPCTFRLMNNSGNLVHYLLFIIAAFSLSQTQTTKYLEDIQAYSLHISKGYLKSTHTHISRRFFGSLLFSDLLFQPLLLRLLESDHGDLLQTRRFRTKGKFGSAYRCAARFPQPRATE